MIHPVMAGGAERYTRRFSHQKRIVGSMGRMTGDAHPVPNRSVFCQRFILAFDRVGMACSADLNRRVQQQALFGRSMRTMAIETALFSDDRRMQPVLREQLTDHFAVASPAELEAPFFESKGVARGRGFMTQAAALVSERLMHFVVKDRGLIRPMYAVARSAFAACNRIIHVLFKKLRFLGLMTSFAERRGFIRKQRPRFF
jgi:hypothetical protein